MRPGPEKIARAVVLRPPEKWLEERRKAGADRCDGGPGRQLREAPRVSADTEVVFVVCNFGTRSCWACGDAIKRGWRQALFLEGGLASWQQAGYGLLRPTPGGPLG